MTATSGQLPAQARADLDRIVNDICRDADLSYDGTAAHIRQTDSQGMRSAPQGDMPSALG